jgi:hypothetical protein
MSRAKSYTVVNGLDHFNIKQLDRLQKRLDVAYATGYINTRLGNDLYRLIEQARRAENVVEFPKRDTKRRLATGQ